MVQDKARFQVGRFISTSVVALAATLALIASVGCTKKPNAPGAAVPGAIRELRVFTWSDYLKDEVLKEFEKENNAKVILDFFSSNEEMLAKVQATIQSGSKGYDVIFPSDYMAGNMRKLGLIQPLDHAKLTFLKDFNPDFLTPAYDPVLSHAVPFAWGTTGVIINTNLAKGLDLSKGFSWKTLLEDPKLAKKITLMDDAKECLHLALMIQGKTWITATEADVRSAFDYLKAHKKNVKLFTSEPKEIVKNGECAVCQGFSGDALRLMTEMPGVKYLVPNEGATIWTDNLAIPKNASEVALAYAFMNKVLSRDAAKRFTEQTFFPSPNGEGMKLLDATLKSNNAIFPDPATFAKLRYLTERPELLQLIDRLWTELKSQ